MKSYIAVILLTILPSATVLAENPITCVKVDNEKISALFDRWNDSLKTGDAKQVANNYLSDAVLLPTVSDKVRLTEAERIDYFEHFLKNKPVGKIDSRTIRLGCNKAIDTGTYTFRFADDSSASARYTFTYAWDGQDWKISSHHSSLMPEK